MTTKTLDHEVLQRLAKASDLIVLSATALIYTLMTVTNSHQVAATGFFAFALAFGCMLILRSMRLYSASAWMRGWRTVGVSLVVPIIAGMSAYFAAPIFGLALPHGWLVAWILVVSTYILISRFVGQTLVGKSMGNQNLRKRIAIVGGGKAAEDAIHLLEVSKDIDADIVGLFDDRYDNRSPESIRKHKKIGKIADLADYARKHAVDLVIVAIPMSAEQRLLQILKRLWELPIDIRISAAAAELKLSPRAYTYLGKLPLLNVFERPLSGWDSFMKAQMDRVIAIVALIVLAPVMLAVAFAVKYESKGPIIFRQKRFGFNNELVEVFKFRSMYTDMSDAAATKLVTKDDPRVTRVGRIIRKTSLDELPQLFNVLLGTLSLVGPRPHATQAKAAGTLYDEVVDGYFARHKVKPGITGWAQINGWRGETDTREKLEQRVKHDLDYIDRWSLAFDLYILAKTPMALLKSENAY
jgi:Undecaprenyl-phosphate glucose phosphotransferase